MNDLKNTILLFVVFWVLNAYVERVFSNQGYCRCYVSPIVCFAKCFASTMRIN